MDTGTFVKYEKCSETAKNHAESVNLYVSIDDHVTVDPLLLPGTLDYTDLIQRRMNGMTVTCKDQFNWIINGRRVNIVVEAINGVQAVTQFVINRSSQITVQYHTHFSKEGALEEKDELVDTLTEAIKSAFENLEAFAALRMPVAKSILLHGVAGAGKKTLIRKAQNRLQCPLLRTSLYDLLALEEEFDNPHFSKYNPLRISVNKAIACKPSILFIEELGSLANGGERTTKALRILEDEIGRIKDDVAVCIIGLSREKRSLPEKLKGTDVFRQHITIPFPTLQQRASMLKQLLHKIRSDTKQNKLHALDDLISDVSLRTSGYVAGDLQMLCRNAIFKSMRRQNGSSADLEQKLASMSLSEPEHSIEIEWSDFEYALSIYRPTQQAEVESTLPKRNWSEIGGYTEIKDRMKQATLWPLLKPEVFIRLGVKPPSGLLLYGPSGCGKTALVQALASESMMNVISIKGPEVFSKYLGETERKIRQLFGTAKRIAPCIVFMDEMDAIGSRRGWDTGDSGGGVNERVLSTLLNEMDGVEGRQGVVVIGCTNRPDHIDDAVLRPGRLDQLLYVGLPSLEDRRDIINALTKTVIVSHDVDKEYLAQNTEYCTGADLENLFREAGTIALRENIHIEAIHNKHLLAALDPIAERAKHEVLEEGILDICTKFQNDHSLQ